jgi:hypothetical protein
MYKIIDNFLPKEELKIIQDVMLGPDFPWYFNNVITDPQEIIDGYYFTHVFFYEDTYGPNSNFFNILIPILNKLDFKALIRVKGNLHPNVNKYVINSKHTDYEFEHKGAIFYVNTNNGYTIIEDDVKIESIENRLLIFDPSKPHSSTNCTDTKRRVNINFNYF